MVGYADERMGLGLAGSSYHMIGQARPDGEFESYSGAQTIASWLLASPLYVAQLD